tara:strand:- start:3039 stop:3821 length:783 start_codon:yes stop_codon:yes gene_type:complete
MATYGSYKKVISGQIVDGSVPSSALGAGTGYAYNVFHVFGQQCHCTSGCCCLWTVPSGVKRVTFELWGSGGNGHGSCSCNRCHHYQGAGGGFYNSKTISTTAGCSYSICAAGVYRCLSRECTGENGCASYVNGYNLSNFCAIGGARGRSNTSWETGCYSEWECCIGPTSNNGDFGMGNHRGHWGGSIFCHCNWVNSCTTNAPFLAGGSGSSQQVVNCWVRCGCWYSPYGQGGQGSMTTYCERCCGQGGTGGGGVVKITYT